MDDQSGARIHTRKRMISLYNQGGMPPWVLINLIIEKDIDYE